MSSVLGEMKVFNFYVWYDSSQLNIPEYTVQNDAAYGMGATFFNHGRKWGYVGGSDCTFYSEETNESKVPKEVVTESNEVRDLAHLFELANDKYAILFYHNPTKPKLEFFNQCNEYLDAMYHADFYIAWGEYKEVAGEYSSEYKNDELRYTMVCKYSGNSYFIVKSAKDFARRVKEAFHKDLLSPNCVTIRRDECLCCRPGSRSLCTHKVPQSTNRKAPYRVWKRKVAPAVNNGLAAIQETDEPADVIQETDEPTAVKETDESADTKPQDDSNLQTSTKEEPPATPKPVLNPVPEDTPEN
ncbi:hypothetical protein GGI17_000484 [Coemansia sp. S146]|nr:hypothetical protein GGI17_000484 [Coemansia sp. S146]